MSVFRRRRYLSKIVRIVGSPADSVSHNSPKHAFESCGIRDRSCGEVGQVGACLSALDAESPEGKCLKNLVDKTRVRAGHGQHPNQITGCRSIALRRKLRALEGPAGGRLKWRLTPPASFHPSSFQSVSQTIDASLLPPSLSSRTSEHCEGPQTTLLGATSSTPPPRRLLALELDTPRYRSPVKETALAIGDAATEPPPPRRRTVPRTGPRSCHCTVAAIAGASSTDFSQRRGRPPADQPSASRGVWNRQLLAGSGFPTTAKIQPNGQTHSAASPTMPTSLLSSRPARETCETTFAKPVATSLDTLSARRWPVCPPKVASRPCRPSPPAQVHLHHVCENPTHRSARGGPCA